MRRTAVVGAALAAVVLLAACHPDPTTGDPPPRSAGVRPFQAPVSRVTAADLGASWRPGCPVHFSRLREVSVPYWNYAGHRRVGRLVVHLQAVEDARAVFRRLYRARFQIRSIRPMSEFAGASDDRSMQQNNTSAFNCRRVAGTSTWSQHAFGRAIDVNPVQNPYVRGGQADPAKGQPWVDRSHGGPGMAMARNPLNAAFAARGWGWGGNWSSAKDYQHFSQNGR